MHSCQAQGFCLFGLPELEVDSSWLHKFRLHGRYRQVLIVQVIINNDMQPVDLSLFLSTRPRHKLGESIAFTTI